MRLQPLAEAQKFCERPSNWVNRQLMANQLKQQKVCCNDPYGLHVWKIYGHLTHIWVIKIMNLP